MKHASQLSRDTIAVAIAAGVAGIAGNLALVGLSPTELVVGQIDAAVVEATPDALVTFSIETLGSSGHALHVALSIGIAVVALGSMAMLGQSLGRAAKSPTTSVVATFGLVTAVALLVTGTPLAALATGAGAGVAVALRVVLRVVRDDPAGVSLDRRRAIEYAASVGVLAAVGSAAGVLRTKQDFEAVGGEVSQTMLDDAAAASFDVAGLQGLVSTRREHFEVDIGAINPSRDDVTHAISVTGAVEDEQEFSMQDLRELPTENRYNTLRCVGDDLNGRKIDTAVWTGTPTNAVLAEIDQHSDCECVMLRAPDGYEVEFPLEALRGGLLAYGMNGVEVPKGHGFPVRALVPGHWGETNVKWLTEIEFLEKPADGYWERRGWQGTGPVETVAKIHAVEKRGDGRVVVAGPAYAGTRGIERVEVTTDGGGTWQDAQLTEPLPGEDVWRHWKADLDLEEQTTVTARATDGTGTLQSSDESGSYPSGASGWVSKEVKP
jgi:hypothetical protein